MTYVDFHLCEEKDNIVKAKIKNKNKQQKQNIKKTYTHKSFKE